MSAIRAWAICVVVLIGSASAVSATTYTWTGGGGANTNWSSAANWGGNGPSDNESDVGLVFPALAGHYNTNNDLTGLRVASLGITTQLSSGTYTFAGNEITLGGAVTMDSPGTGTPNLVWQIPVVLGGDVTITASGRQTQLQGPVDLASHTLTLATLGDIVLAGVVSGSGNLIKTNNSALTVRGANTYTGSTTSNAGAFYIDSAAALGDAANGTTFNGGFLGFGGESFTISEPLVFNGGGILVYGTPSIGGQITLNATIGVNVFEATGILTIDEPIVGSGGLSKDGPGLLVLDAPSELYAGATAVDEGTLQLDTALSSTDPVTVQHGATLRGSGSSQGAFTVQDGGTIAPGSSPGVLSGSGLTMFSGGIFAAEIDGPDAPQYDTIVAAGPVELDGATLTVSLGYAPLDGQELTLISHLHDEPVSGTFAGLAEGAMFQVGGATFTITYAGGGGSDVVLIAGTPHTPTGTPTAPTATSTVPPTTTLTSTPIPTQTATAAVPTPTRSIAVTATATQASSATRTSAATPTSTPAIGATPTRTAPSPSCAGDCNGDGMVLVNELIVGVNIALEQTLISACEQFDGDGDGTVTIAELIRAVNNALSGCT